MAAIKITACQVVVIVFCFLLNHPVFGQDTPDREYRNKYQNQEIEIHYSKTEEEGEFFLVGQVLAKPDNTPVSGMNIIPEGSMFGTVTNKKGEFKVKLPNSSGTILFFLNIYKTIKLKYK